MDKSMMITIALLAVIGMMVATPTINVYAKKQSREYRGQHKVPTQKDISNEQKANNILANKKAVVLAAVIAVLGALRNRPDKQQLLIYNSFYPLNNGAVDISTKNDVFICSKYRKLSSTAILS